MFPKVEKNLSATWFQLNQQHELIHNSQQLEHTLVCLIVNECLTSSFYADRLENQILPIYRFQRRS